MKKYIIFSDSFGSEFYKKEFKDNAECIKWIENHLDLSKNWQFRIYNN